MKLTIAPLAVPVLIAGVAAWIVPVLAWDQWRTGLLPAISVVAGAVLVRLARGFPFTNTDHFTLEDFRRVTAALKKIAKSLRALIAICMGSMVILILAPAISSKAHHSYYIYPDASFTDRCLSFVIGLAISYVFVRALQIVDSDISLLQLQTEVLDRVISRRNAKNMEEAVAPDRTGAIAGAEGYGRSLQ